MSERKQTARRDARTAGKTARDGGARCVAIVDAANAGLAIGGLALIADIGAQGAEIPFAALAAVAAALVARRIAAYILKGGAA